MFIKWILKIISVFEVSRKLKIDDLLNVFYYINILNKSIIPNKKAF